MSFLARDIYDSKYDFLGQNYASLYPNLHKYPATMLPQIGLELLREFGASKNGALLDPFCGSGSSFVSALDFGIKNVVGFDLNPLAIMISSARLSYIDSRELLESRDKLLTQIAQNLMENQATDLTPLQNITNLDFWLEKDAQRHLAIIFSAIKQVPNNAIKNLFTLAFSETLRESSYTRNNEFKLFRMKDFARYKPDSHAIFNKFIANITNDYLHFYQPKLHDFTYKLKLAQFSGGGGFETVLTSPPYGDSKTTVAYGQFSTFINEWLGFKEARKLDSALMGGKKAKTLYEKGVMREIIAQIARISPKRALEISSFYYDLESHIKIIANALNIGGKAFYIIGNRRVKNTTLPTDKFIAEAFCALNFKHLATIRRKISNKSMPLQNSPTNKMGAKSTTMNEEYLVVCEKK